MADPRILPFRISTPTGTTHFQIERSADQVTWTKLRVGGTTELLTSLLTSNVYTLDGVNSTDDADNTKVATSTPPLWYRHRTKGTNSAWTAWTAPYVFPSPDDFLAAIKRQLKDPALSSGTALMGDLDYLRHLANAVRAFEARHPALASQIFDMADLVQSYTLPLDWSYEFSRIQAVEYPVESSEPKSFIDPAYVLADETRGQWRFIRILPSSTEDTRLYYTVRHGRDGSTIPVTHFESVVLYAAGCAAEQIWAEKTQFGDVVVGADYVMTDPRIKQWDALSKRLKAAAMEQWGSGAASIRANISLYDDHGNLPGSIFT